MKLRKGNTDLVTSFSVYLNNEKLSGVYGFSVNADISGDLRTKVTLNMNIKRDSLRVYRQKGYRIFSFETTNYTGNKKFTERNKLRETGKTFSDITHNDVIVMNGEKLHRVINFDLSLAPDSATHISITLSLAWNGLEIHRFPNGQKELLLTTADGE